MNQLQFVRGETTFKLSADGSVTARKDGVEVQGQWFSRSAREENVLTLTLPDQEQLTVPVMYSFHTKLSEYFQNILRVEVPAEDGGNVAFALFGGKIVIDDKKDIEYRSSGGQTFFLYGDLSFSKAYDKLRITFDDGGTAEIDGRPDLAAAHIPDRLEEADLLTFGALTVWTDDGVGLQVEPAEIQLSGHISPENGRLRFFGSVKGEKTFEITLAGRYEAFGGGIRIWRDEDGETAAALTVVGTLDFRGATGRFGISLGHSAQEKLSLTAQFAFAGKKTDEDGNAILQGSGEINATDREVKVDLNLKGRFKIDESRLVAFEIDLEVSDGKLDLTFGGMITVGKDKELSLTLVHSQGETSIELAYTDTVRDTWIKILAGDTGLSISFSVTFTFPTADAHQPVTGPAQPVLESDSTTAADVPAVAGLDEPSSITPPAMRATQPAAAADITPESYPGYPRTSVGCFNSFQLLHPVVRRLVTQLQNRLHTEGIPLFVFESFRSPQRQNKLHRKIPKVTNARAWESCHQFGVAVDFVFHEQGNWHWGKNSQHTNWYKQLHQYARELGLEPLSWEKPHIQLSGLELADLQRGRYPVAGDSHWGMHLAEVIASWNAEGDLPAAPPPPQAFFDIDRPALDVPDAQPGAGGRRVCRPEDFENEKVFHSRYGGIEWKVVVGGDVRGVIVKGRRTPERTHGEPVTCRKIVSLYGDLVAKAAVRFDVPEELIIMTIATETAAFRQHAYTGPQTFRWESHIGEYSAGPMQTLSSTVRWLIDKYGLDYSPKKIAPRFGAEPNPAPASHPLYDPELNIELGALAIKERLEVTGYDPILVAAAYNAGSLNPSNSNRWHLRSHSNHIDRAARWFGDVFAI